MQPPTFDMLNTIVSLPPKHDDSTEKVDLQTYLQTDGMQ